MISLSSTEQVVASLRSARDIALTAYLLRPGRVLDALEAAARAGAHVTVRLEGSIYKDDGLLASGNGQVVAALNALGADARLVHCDDASSDPLLHAKMIVADHTVFLDDRNWADDGQETILRDSFEADARMVRGAVAGTEEAASPFFALRKRDALASEARLLEHAQPHGDVIVESESFGSGNSVFRAIDALAKRGLEPRVLVNDRVLTNNPNEQKAIAQLERDGAHVRSCNADEKFAIAEARGWVGSANATMAFDHPDQLDWGLRSDDGDVIAQLRKRFENRWGNAVPAVIAGSASC